MTRRLRMRRILKRPTLLAFTTISIATLVFFFPLFRNYSFSTVQMYENAIFPWAAVPNGLRWFPQSDQAALSYPWQIFYAKGLQKGVIPFWNPHSFLYGYPLMPNGSSAFLSPLRFTTTLLSRDSQQAHDLFSLLCVLFGGFAAYACSRAFDLRPFCATFTALSWMFAGWNLAWLHLEVVAPLSFALPLVLLCVRKGVDDESLSWTLGGCCAVALSMVCGHVLVLGIVVLTGTAYAMLLGLRRVVDRDWSGARQYALYTCIMFVGGGALSAVVVLPTLLNVAGSQRVPFSYSQLQSVFLGEWQSFTVRAFIPPELPISDVKMHQMGFVGTIAGLFAIWGAFRKTPAQWVGVILWLLPFLIAVGTPLTWAAYYILPGFTIFRPYSRLVFISAFGLCLLAGTGLEGFLARAQAHPSTGRRLARSWAVWGVAVCAMLLNTVQLVNYGRKINPPFVPERLRPFPNVPVLRALSDAMNVGWPSRVLPLQATDDKGSWRPVLFGDVGTALGIDVATGYDSAVPKRSVDLLRVLAGESVQGALDSGLPSAFTPAFRSASLRAEMLPRLGVDLVLSTPSGPEPEHWTAAWHELNPQEIYSGLDGRVYRLRTVLTGPYLATRARTVTTPAAALQILSDGPFQRGHDAIIEVNELQGAVSEADANGEIIFAERDIDRVRLVVASNEPAYVVLPVAYSPGWLGTVSGRPATVIHANYAELAVHVPAGTSEIALVYRPPGFRLGMYVSLLALVLGTVGFIASRRRQLRSSRSSQ